MRLLNKPGTESNTGPRDIEMALLVVVVRFRHEKYTEEMRKLVINWC
jgi:hypothetical protein